MRKLLLALGALSLGLPGAASAQTGPVTQYPTPAYPNPCVFTAANQCTGVSTATPMPVSVASGGGSSNVPDTYIAPAPYPATSGTVVTIPLGNGQGAVGVTITGLTASGATLSVTASDNKGANAYPVRFMGTATVPGATTITADGLYTFATSGHTAIYLTVTTGGSGNFTVASNASLQPRTLNLEGAGTASTNPLFASVSGTVIASNAGFGAYGSAGTAYQQGAGAAGANAQNVYIGGQNAAVNVTGTVSATQGTSPWVVSNGGTFVVQNNAATPSGGNVIGGVIGNLGYPESTTPLAANASFQGPGRQAPVWASYFGCNVSQTGGGTASLYISDGGPTVVAGTQNNVNTSTASVDVTARVRGPSTKNYSCYLVNGTTAQVAMKLESSFTAN